MVCIYNQTLGEQGFENITKKFGNAKVQRREDAKKDHDQAFLRLSVKSYDEFLSREAVGRQSFALRTGVLLRQQADRASVDV